MCENTLHSDIELICEFFREVQAHIPTVVHRGTGLDGTPLLVFELSTIFISALMFHVLPLLHIYMFSEEKLIGVCGLL